MQLLSEAFLILTRTERGVIKSGLQVQYLLFLPHLMKPEDSRKFFFFFENTDTKFHANLSGGSRVVSMRADRRTDGQTDKHDEATSHFSQFYELA